jgi:hypothetical protein
MVRGLPRVTEMKMSLDEIEKEITEIIGFISCYYNKDNGNEVSERITNLNIYLARTSVLLSEAQFLFDERFSSETEKLIGNELLTASTINNLAKSRCAIENKLLKLVDRINSTITHQLDSIRSQLSYLKSFNNQ